jgi:hypothetical protein
MRKHKTIMDAINDRSGKVEEVESNFSMANLKNMLSAMAGHKQSNEPKIAGCRNCGDLFDISIKSKCNCGNVDFSQFNGGEAEAKAEKGMKQLRSWKQNKK